MVTWPVFYSLLFAYRAGVALVMMPVVGAFTTLGDSYRYAIWTKMAYSPALLWDSTAMTDTIGAILRTLFFGSALMVGVGFQSIAFVGLLKLLLAVEPKIRRKLIVFMMLPSFTIWTSMPSKEAVVVFALGIVLSYAVAHYQGKQRLTPLHLLGFYLLILYKSQYLPAILFLIFVTRIAPYIRQKGLFVLTVGLISLLPLYLFRDKIDALAFEVQIHFPGMARSTRGDFFFTQYDVFTKMFSGMFQSFFGPTWTEAQVSVLHMVAFFESAVLIGLFIFYTIRQFPRMPAFSFFLSSFVIFWILFPTYPLGVMNPGTAVRYRTGYLLIIFLVMIVYTSRDLYEARIAKRRPQLPAPLPSPQPLSADG
jgi:hypothetical protein